LAVTGTERSTYVPELPAVAESINDFEVYNWIGLFVSSGRPADTIAYLDKTVREIMQNDELRKSLDETGMAPTVRADAADFQQFFNEELSRWGNFLRTSNFQLN